MTVAVATPAEGRSRVDRLLDLTSDYGVFVALVAVFAYFSIAASDFLTGTNMAAIGNSAAVLGILAAPFTIALVAGQVDLSVAGQMGVLAAIFEVAVVRDGHSLALGILLMLAAGLAVGLLNGSLVVDFGINSIIVTFAMIEILFAVANTLFKLHRTNAEASGEFTSTIAPGHPGYAVVRIANSDVLGIPTSVLVLLAVYVVLYLLLSHTPLGWRIYATGGNRGSALRAGIRVDALTRLVFLLTPIGAVLGALILIGRTGQPDPNMGYGMEFDVLTAALIGGIGLSGGGGRVERTLAGVLLVTVIGNGLSITNVDNAVQYVVRAGVLLLAVVLSAIATKRRAR